MATSVFLGAADAVGLGLNPTVAFAKHSSLKDEKVAGIDHPPGYLRAAARKLAGG